MSGYRICRGRKKRASSYLLILYSENNLTRVARRTEARLPKEVASNFNKSDIISAAGGFT